MSRPPRWSWVGLALVLALDLWLRAHTFGPTLRDRWGVDLWPVSDVEAEPIDCDEAVYTYVGRRILQGGVLYRDLSEPKPPGGYWLYTLGVALGGDSELMVHLLPVPLVMMTIALVWWIAGRLAGPVAALAAALTFAIASTDPYLFGNGSNLEHAMSLGTVGALAAVLAAWQRADGGHPWLFVAGLFLGFAALFKQVSVLHAPFFAIALALRSTGGRSFRARLVDVAVLAVGVAVLPMLAALILVLQGAGPAAYEDIFTFAGAMVRDLPAEPNQPPALVRWFTGNADPAGNLPFPFGRTDYLVWWGLGTWPLWLAAVPALARLATGPAARRLVLAWTLSAWVQVFMPRLFWAHYFLLPVPGLAIALAVWLGDGVTMLGQTRRRARGLFAVTVALVALVMTGVILTRDYLLVSPVQLTVRYKGGRQWVALREMGRDLKKRTADWEDARLFQWGWQSPLFVYSGLDGVSREFFANNLIKEFAEGDHPLVRPRIEGVMHDLERRPPDLIFCGYPPFASLRKFLQERYVRAGASPDGRGLWVLQTRYADFQRADPSAAARPSS
jgi:4-amino-4-deoxy-L-arabinose transferase-like glycosyltransferase